MRLTVPVLRVLAACRWQRTDGPITPRPTSGKPVDSRDVYRMVLRIPRVASVLLGDARTLARRGVRFLTAYVAGVSHPRERAMEQHAVRPFHPERR